MPKDPYLETVYDPRSRFRGKFSGVVVNNNDLNRDGKLQIRLPEVLGDKQPWARPCVPYAAEGLGLFMMPPNGTRVWVEFEDGSLDQPIWTGFEWPKGGAPAASPKEMVIATPSGTIKFNAENKKGEITIEAEKMTITLRDDAVTLKAPGGATIEMKGTTTAINKDGLEVD